MSALDLASASPAALAHEEDPVRLCLVLGGQAAFDAAAVLDVPVLTYCGDWVYPDVVDEAEALVSRTVDCPACDAARDAGAWSQ